MAFWGGINALIPPRVRHWFCEIPSALWHRRLCYKRGTRPAKKPCHLSPEPFEEENCEGIG